LSKGSKKGLLVVFQKPTAIGVLILLAVIVFNVSEMKAAPEQAGQWQTVRMRVTAYCACRKCCGKFADGITASGHKIVEGDAFAAADKRFSFGTEMVIAGYNNDKSVKVLDRGGAIRGNRLDVFFNSHRKALKWGVKYIDIKVRRTSETL
jgi:3D (Asp-Asp-Asp) domain-containing protein